MPSCPWPSLPPQATAACAGKHALCLLPVPLRDQKIMVRHAAVFAMLPRFGNYGKLSPR